MDPKFSKWGNVDEWDEKKICRVQRNFLVDEVYDLLETFTVKIL